MMHLGRIVEVAERDKLYRNPLMPCTQALLLAVPVFDLRIRHDRIVL
jgi:oligopeptide transport system ATP-binding protein